MDSYIIIKLTNQFPLPSKDDDSEIDTTVYEGIVKVFEL